LGSCHSGRVGAYNDEQEPWHCAALITAGPTTGLETIMNRLSLLVLLAFCAGSAFAQSATVSTIDDKGKVDSATVALTPQEKAADAFCLRQTGSHLKSMTNDRNDSAVQCANEPGRSYSREDIQRTGATNTADALRRLDPSIH
jgi:hypothetical protein